MKTIRVQFDYEGKHYDVQCSVKRNIKKHEWEQTLHGWNEDVDFYNNDDEYYSVWHYDDYVEVQVSHDLTKIENVLLWSKDEHNGCIIAALGEFENFKGRISGIC